MRTLVAIAHPDDECMFFYPTISGLLDDGHEVYLVCLSTGNHYGLGDCRTSELYHSCSLLGIPQSRVRIVNDNLLQDGMNNRWDTNIVQQYVTRVMHDVGAEALVTFDGYGVSGHPNHKSVWAGVVSAWERLGNDSTVELYILKSSNVFIKYSGIFSLVAEPFLDVFQGMVVSRVPSITFCNTSVRSVWQAMLCHASQMTWYRRLFVLFSQYSYNNRLIRVCR